MEKTFKQTPETPRLQIQPNKNPTGRVTDNSKPPKTSGIKIRGNGAATRGTIARGPMA